jgi:predicted nuclease of predicted toxin-antitoxin system
LKILVDENIPRKTVDELRNAGHDVRDLRQTLQQGSEDSELWAAAMADRRLLISTDRGFTEYRKVDHHGILIVRLRQPNRERIHQAVLLALARFQEAQWRGLLVVVRDTTLSVSRSGGPVEQI